MELCPRKPFRLSSIFDQFIGSDTLLKSLLAEIDNRIWKYTTSDEGLNTFRPRSAQRFRFIHTHLNRVFPWVNLNLIFLNKIIDKLVRITLLICRKLILVVCSAFSVHIHNLLENIPPGFIRQITQLIELRSTKNIRRILRININQFTNLAIELIFR